MKSFHIAALAGVLLATPAQALIIDFDSLPAGTIVTNSVLPPGMTISVQNNHSSHPNKAVIFDSACPPGFRGSDCTGNDPDLLTPGVGIGNDTAQNKVLVIADNVIDVSPANGLVDNPGDEAWGGKITFTFPTPTKLVSIRIIDIDVGQPNNRVVLFLTDGSTRTFYALPLGNNSAQTMVFPEPRPLIDGFQIILPCSGAAFDDIVTEPTCGNDVKEQGEQCDCDDDDACPGECRSDCTCPGATPFCGDGEIIGEEECDDGEANSDTEPNACRTDCTLPRCGDGVIDGAEAAPELAPLVPPETGEECDDGAANSDTEPGACRTDCRKAYCGDSVIDGDEECDNGAANSDTEPDACRTDCKDPYCGDNIIDDGEECDDGSVNGDPQPGSCRSDCTVPSCGDGIKDPGEQCDDGELNSDTTDYACGTNCIPHCHADPLESPESPFTPNALVARNGVGEPVCCNGVIEDGEECDDGFDNSNEIPDACRENCLNPDCGDGVIDTGETCDDGAGNSNAPDACRLDCTLPRCGDGIIDKATEQCEPTKPNPELCNNLVDDDADGLVDCHDPDCAPGMEICTSTCTIQPPCERFAKDPAYIRFNRDEPGKDFFSVHGRYILRGQVDLSNDRFALVLSNANGVIYQGTLAAGQLTRMVGGKGRYVFRDGSARRQQGGDADGIYRVGMRVKAHGGVDYVHFRARVIGDFSAATEARMTIQLGVGTSVGALTADWRKQKNGWYLRDRFFASE